MKKILINVEMLVANVLEELHNIRETIIEDEARENSQAF